MAKKKQPEIQTLYFNKETYNVTSETPSPYSYDLESFIPSVSNWKTGDNGWVVFGLYGTYDSYGPGSDYIDVVDIYPTEEEARQAAEAIVAYKKACDQISGIFSSEERKDHRTKIAELKKAVTNAKGETVQGLYWIDSWGYDPLQVQVQEVTINLKEKHSNVYSLS